MPTGAVFSGEEDEMSNPCLIPVLVVREKNLKGQSYE
jgi:hypothetical protein